MIDKKKIREFLYSDRATPEAVGFLIASIRDSLSDEELLWLENTLRESAAYYFARARELERVLAARQGLN